MPSDIDDRIAGMVAVKDDADLRVIRCEPVLGVLDGFQQIGTRASYCPPGPGAHFDPPVGATLGADQAIVLVAFGNHVRAPLA